MIRRTLYTKHACNLDGLAYPTKTKQRIIKMESSVCPLSLLPPSIMAGAFLHTYTKSLLTQGSLCAFSGRLAAASATPGTVTKDYHAESNSPSRPTVSVQASSNLKYRY